MQPEKGWLVFGGGGHIPLRSQGWGWGLGAEGCRCPGQELHFRGLGSRRLQAAYPVPALDDLIRPLPSCLLTVWPERGLPVLPGRRCTGHSV